LIRLLSLAFLLSGISALVYETAWTRLLLSTFGATAPAAATVLATFMGGLALGAWGGGRIADRRSPQSALTLYAGAELLVALFAYASPFFLQGLDDALVSAERVTGRALLVSAVLLPPTVLLGATLPLAVRALPADVVRFASRLYAVNTFGAVLGALAAGFVLLPTLGVTGTIHAAAGLTAIAAAVGWAASRRAPQDAPEEGPGRRLPIGTLGLAAAIAGLSGLGALACEVLWTRALVLAMGSTSQAFATMLAVFLVGIAAGAAVAPAILRRIGDPLRMLAILQGALGVLALVAFGIGARLPFAFLWLHEALPAGFGWQLVARTLLAAALLLPSTLLLGATFTAALALAGGNRARDVGLVYGVNSAGSVLGALLAGLWALPRFGMEGAIAAAGVVHLLAMALALARGGGSPAFRAATALLALGGFALASSGESPWDPRVVARGFFFFPRLYTEARERGRLDELIEQSRTVYHRDGASASILVLRDRESLGFIVDGKPEATTVPRDMRNQYLLGHLPALLHRGPVGRGLVVGLGSGMTAGCLSLHAKRTTVAELTPEVVRAASFFGEWNHGVLKNRTVKVHNDDARHFLRATRERYDVITSDPIHPYVRGSESLYSRDYFRRVKGRLAKGGVVAQWLPLYQMGLDDTKTVVATFREVFPDATVWVTISDAVLIGGTGRRMKKAMDIGVMASLPAVHESLRRVYAGDPAMVLAARVAGPEGLRRFVRGARISTDDRPVLEFSAPRRVHEQTVSRNLRAILAVRDDPHWDLTGLPPDIRADVVAAREAMRHEVLGIALREEEKEEDALREFQAAFRAYPRAHASRSLAYEILMADARGSADRRDRASAEHALSAAHEADPAGCDALQGLYELARAKNDRELGRRMLLEAERAGCAERRE